MSSLQKHTYFFHHDKLMNVQTISNNTSRRKIENNEEQQLTH